MLTNPLELHLVSLLHPLREKGILYETVFKLAHKSSELAPDFTEYLRFQITMEDIHKSVASAENGMAVTANGAVNGAITGLGDKRLGLFGYTIESINMLLVPMIQNK